jgi:hypothetical protein
MRYMLQSYTWCGLSATRKYLPQRSNFNMFGISLMLAKEFIDGK